MRERSTFAKTRHGRLAEGDVMRRVFDLVVGVCADNGLIGGTGALVDSSTVHADANRARQAAPEEVEATWAASDGVSRPVQDYLDVRVANAAPAPGPKHKPPKYLSETDPQAAWSLKDGPGHFSYEVNYLADDKHAIIVDVEGTPARLSQEIIAAKAMLDRHVAGYDPESIAADNSYGTGPFLSWLLERKITPYIPVLDPKAQTFSKYTRDAFEYDAANDFYVCPQSHQLPLKSIDEDTRVKRYKTIDTLG
ncbi:MAG: hypothetical protein AB8B71_19905 [Paracoccaceae bacterium]